MYILLIVTIQKENRIPEVFLTVERVLKLEFALTVIEVDHFIIFSNSAHSTCKHLNQNTVKVLRTLLFSIW